MLDIQVNTQSSIRINASKVIYFDPFTIKDDSHDADIIFITHKHFDHLDIESIQKIEKSTTQFVAPISLQQEMAPWGERVLLCKPGEEYEIEGISFETVPAYNIEKEFHKKEFQWLGYIATIDGQRIYVAGDTDVIPEMDQIQCDLACIPIGGHYTMTYEEAAQIINRISPKTVIPIHYGSIVGKPEFGEAFKSLVKNEIDVQFRLKF